MFENFKHIEPSSKAREDNFQVLREEESTPVREAGATMPQGKTKAVRDEILVLVWVSVQATVLVRWQGVRAELPGQSRRQD